MRRALPLALLALLFCGCPPQKKAPTPPPPPPETGLGDTSPGPPPPSDPPPAEDPPPADLTQAAPQDPPPEGEPPEDEPPEDEGPTEPPPPKELPWAFPASDGAIDLFPGIRLYKDEERLEVKGAVCIKRGPTLELLGCTERGKTHESLLLFACNPKQLHLALVMLGLKPTPQVETFGEQKALGEGEKVVLEVTWSVENAPDEDTSAPEPKDGRITRRAEDLVYDQVKKASMPRVGWVFTGSRNVQVPKPPDWETKHEVYAAEYAGNVAAVYHDPDALLDTPLLEGGDDTVYIAYSDRMPERGTPVLLHLRKWKAGDGPETGAAPTKDAPKDDAGDAPKDDAGDAPKDDAPEGDGPKDDGEDE